MTNTNKIRSAVSIATMCVSMAGVVTTAVLTAKATPKAQELLAELKLEKLKPTKTEVVKKVAPIYLPAAVSGALTIGCIVATTVLSRKSQASLAGAYALLNHNYQRYRGTVKRLFGEEADQQVIDEIVKSKCDFTGIITPGIVDSSTLDFGVDEDIRLFYDSFSERYFESTIGRVLQAEYHLNRNYSLGMEPTPNEFYEFLGLEPTLDGDSYSWDPEDGWMWIDFNNRKVILDGGLECCVIDFAISPKKENDEDYYFQVR